MRERNPQGTALIDISRATRQPERLATLLTRLGEELKLGRNAEKTFSTIEKLARADQEVTSRLAKQLAQNYMPQHGHIQLCNGEQYWNQRAEEPRYITTGVKSPESIASKVGRKAQGKPIIYQTGKRPEGKFSTIYKFGDIQRLKVITKSFDEANRLMDQVVSNPKIIVAHAQEHRGGNTGEYYANHADLLVDGIRVELQIRDVKSELRQNRDDYHSNTKNDFRLYATTLAQVESMRG